MTHEELIADGLVSPDEAMRFLGISRPTLNRLLDQGVLPTVRLVTTRRIPRRALVDLAARSVVMPLPPAAED
jgi:excisionase family DNA binding protein